MKHELINYAIDSGDGILYAPKLQFEAEYPISVPEDVCVGGYITSGSLDLNLNGNRHTLNPGELFILQSGDIVQEVVNSSDCRGCIMVIDATRMLELAGEVDLYRYLLYLKENPVIIPSSSSREIIASCLYMIDCKLTDTKSGWIKPQKSVNHLLHTLVVEVFEVLNRMDICISRTHNNVFQRFMEILCTTAIHYHPVDWYARRLNVTAKHLSEVSRKCSGRPASAWIKDYAMLDIKKYLADDKLSIKEVAYLLEYPNLSLFGKCVRRWFGMSPSALRVSLATQ